ncbi:FkbM family methyltransferase [Pseudoduganella namucuonensis]|uniref:Methyltransferase, FkbM family n=1 Tax=Pseudoduganella namucuonensis TaxID=1035707 RepID=A0A1I7FSR5_9BURK|nr:FkbM family methyltransferase [Pseudoduganella namucuonensis]SFU39203.1 methyltransferase, FkbM family [Pseudoduganella namucuonensis]
MTFISYSQNFEDVLLWRALGKVQNGFYIDVGANDPVLHSVTKAFYDAGWRGINIEPMPSYRQPFLDQRPRDINLGCAAGAEAGEITLFDVPTMNGWASTDSGVAVAHKAEGYEVTETRVPMRTLADICAEHVTGEIHFLKIDVEGFEGEVLKGMDLRRWRPWVLVIEATLPGQRVTNHETWEHLVTPHGYRYAYFDGLNRYYVAEEHAELMADLDIQPNVFDAFISHHLDAAWARGKDLSKQVKAGWERIEQMDGQARELAEAADQARRRTAQLDAQLHAEREAAAAAAAEAAAVAEAAAAAAAREAIRAAEEIQQTQSRLHAAEERERQLQATLHTTDQWGKDLEQRLLAVYASSSWRITAPLRLIMRRGPNSLANIFKRKARGALRRGLRWLTSRESLRRAVLPLVARSPWLQERVARTLAAAKSATSPDAPIAPDLPHALRELPQSARAVLADLQRAYEQQAKH